MSHTDFYKTDRFSPSLDQIEAAGDGGLDLSRLHLARFENGTSAAYKLVETFASICRRKIWLKDSGHEHAQTDGHEVRAPFKDERFYRLVEHELSHVLFRSDANGREKFIEDYCAKIHMAATKYGADIDQSVLHDAVAHLVNVLEDRRVNSLWGRLYPGSAADMRAQNKRFAEARLAGLAEVHLLAYMSCIECGIDPGGRFASLGPAIREALRKVDGRGFSATLIASKWLLVKMVDQLLRESQKQPQNPQQGGTQQPQKGSKKGSGGSGGTGTKQEAKPGDGDGDDGDGDPDEQNGDPDDGSGDSGSEGDNASDGDSDGDSKDGDTAKDFQDQQSPSATPQERTQALADLAAQMERKPKDHTDDFTQSQFSKNFVDFKMQQEVAKAIACDVNNGAQMSSLLAQSAADMARILEAAMNAMRQQMHEDEWLAKEAKAKVTFADHHGERALPLSREDQETVRRLRAVFYRVMGSKRVQLEEDGTEIDVPAYVQGLVSETQEPSFKHEVRGRGFKCLILVDRSGSMAGDKTAQAERSCRIITQALKFPFVDLCIWGFKSKEQGAITITRFDPRKAAFEKLDEAGGLTPLHIATRLGVRQLGVGTEAKQLVLLSDGFPCAMRRDGRSFDTKQLMLFVRDEVQDARNNGIAVSSVMIGMSRYGRRDDGSWGTIAGEGNFDVEEEDMKFMFGTRKNWKRVVSERLGRDLVQLITTTFVDYLKNC